MKLGTVLAFGITLTIAVVGFFLSISGRCPHTSTAIAENLPVGLSSSGPYLILVSEGAGTLYSEAVEEAKRLHPEASTAAFAPGDEDAILDLLRKYRPYYALLFMTPDELDVNFAWMWLRLTTQIDDDPFVDVRSGFITGRDPKSAARMVRRIAEAVEGKRLLPAALVDNLGPNPSAAPSGFHVSSTSFFLPVFAHCMDAKSISHGVHGFTKDRMDSMKNAGLVHFGGHGFPNRIVDGINGPWVRRLVLSPCVVFNGACYTGVTGVWFDTRSGMAAKKKVVLGQSFCLGILATDLIGYLAALHPDHGIPVYQEMEFMAYTGASLGDVMKHTHDGVILAGGKALEDLTPLTDGTSLRNRTPSEVMLTGTASRVLFGDPALLVMEAITDAPFSVEVAPALEDNLQVKATLKNESLKSTFTDTYYSDLASDRRLFNEMARFVVDLPDGWNSVSRVRIRQVAVKGQELASRLVGFGLEEDRGRHRLHVQVDVPSTGYMNSPFRKAGATVHLEVSR